jgi:hypothetical protein
MSLTKHLPYRLFSIKGTLETWVSFKKTTLNGAQQSLGFLENLTGPTNIFVSKSPSETAARFSLNISYVLWGRRYDSRRQFHSLLKTNGNVGEHFFENNYLIQ